MAASGDHGENFLTAGVVTLLARLLHRKTLTIRGTKQSRTIDFDGETTLARLLAEVSRTGTALDAETDFLDAIIVATPLREVAGSRHSPSTLTFYVEPADGGVEKPDNGGWELSVAAPHWTRQTTERVAHYLLTLLEHAATGADQPCEALPLMSAAEALELYQGLNATVAAYPRTSVQELIAEQAAIDPIAEAVVFQDAVLSYRELQSRSDSLAVHLRARGADQQHPVAIAMPRSEHLPVVILAALKAGSFFVPLDPTHPRQRLLDILAECEPAVVMVTQATASLFSGDVFGRTLPLLVNESLPLEDEAPHEEAVFVLPAARATDKAYTIYTSGTTGKPKGVMIPQRALVNFVASAQREPGLRRGDRMLAVATLSFDMSIMDIFLPLVSGATIVVASENDARDPARLSGLLGRQRITCMQATPTTWRMLIAHGWKAARGLRMLAGGEALPRDLANALMQADGDVPGELWNCYGPTETTVYSSFLRMQIGEGRVPIGAPIANTSFYIADPAGHLLPPEVAGELYIGGDGVALGYFERPTLDREKFVANRWAGDSSQKLFRTGDAARLLPDGTFEFFGRLDSQVKLRGYRIELGEIEAVLRAHADVQDAAAVLREDEPGEPWLVGYVTTADQGSFDSAALRKHAARHLPGYMLPARLVALASLPLTGSGKIDRRALQELPAPVEVARPGTNHDAGEQPVDHLEATLLKIFREVLRSPSIGLDDSFFEHGGYSLLAVRLFARIDSTLGRSLPITALFDAPTARALAALLRAGQELATLVPIRASGTRAPFFMVQSYLLYGLAGTMVPEPHPVFGLRESAALLQDNGASFDERVTTCVSAIESVYPQGLIHVGGWCAAAPLTIEIARRLQQHGRPLGMIALFDAESPGFKQKPAEGNVRLARARATWKYHIGRLRKLGWKAKLDYVAERLTQQTLQCVEWVYMRHRGFIAQLHRVMPFLPAIFFYNRWTQLRIGAEPVLQPIDARVYLLRASDVVMVPGSDPAMGWNAIARRGVEVIFVPGHHESMFHEPQLRVLRQRMGQALLQVENDSAS